MITRLHGMQSKKYKKWMRKRKEVIKFRTNGGHLTWIHLFLQSYCDFKCRISCKLSTIMGYSVCGPGGVHPVASVESPFKITSI